MVHNEAQIDWLAAHKTQRPQQVFLKLNTGMNRLGFTPDAYRSAWLRLSGLQVNDQGIASGDAMGKAPPKFQPSQRPGTVSPVRNQRCHHHAEHRQQQIDVPQQCAGHQPRTQATLPPALRSEWCAGD